MFCHLHNHTEYSVLDGHGKIVDYVKSAVADGQTALAITDHGTMGGAIEFYAECKKAGIKPIIGAELYVDMDVQEEKFPDHLTVLAANLQGYRDLIKINTAAHNAFYYRPRVSLRELLDSNMLKNLIVLTGCPSSTLNKLLKKDDVRQAQILLKMLAKGSKQLAIEIQYHQSDDTEFRQMQSDLLYHQFELAASVGLPLALTNDCHYVTEEDEGVHQAYLVAAEGRVHGIEFDGTGFYLKSSDDMYSIAGYLDHPDAYDNTSALADLCDLAIPEIDAPKWYVPSAYENPEGEIHDRCNEIAHNDNVEPEYGTRYEQEMVVISTSSPIMNSYLVAADLVAWCREQGIPATGRGSMAGSLVSYLLGITSEDPIKHNLNFKRAVNPARLTIPDFDIDVSSTRRGDVLAYIANKYPHSTPIASYTERGVKSATRDVMRALNYTVEDTNYVSKELPEKFFDMSDLEAVPEGAREVVAGYLGLYRNMTVHPAGILVSGPEKPLDELVPMGWVASSKQMVSQYDMYSLKLIDMFKLDVLGVATLDAMALMEELSGEQAPTEYDDISVFELLSKGLVCEIFQLDGFAARTAIRQLGIRSFEDIVAINALVRPGASQFIPSYRTGDGTLTDAYPPLNNVLGVTRGLILYQEQVMEVAEVLAGFDDLLQDDIKEAIKYFRAEVFAELEPKFMAGCAQNGHDGTLIWQAIKAFAGYAFNRAHAVTYAATAYKMAWYKLYHPEAFYTALYDRADSKIRLILESLQLGVEWVLPDVNTSGATTTLADHKITLGLTALKGIGPAVADAVVATRTLHGGRFASYAAFEADKTGVPKQKCNIKAKKILQDAGACGSLGIMANGAQEEILGFNPIIADQSIAAEVTVYEHNRIGGFLISSKEHTIKKAGPNEGERMGFLTLINGAGEFEVTMFPKAWKRFKNKIKAQRSMAPVILHGEDGPRGFVAEGGDFYA